MRRRDDRLTPEMERELDALDLALSGEGSDPELAGLVSAVCAERAVPREEFAGELDAWAAGGFGRRRSATPVRHGGRAAAFPSGAGPRRRGAALAAGVHQRAGAAARAASGPAARVLARLPRRSLLSALGVAASLLVAVVVAVSALQGTEPERPASPVAPAPPLADQGLSGGGAPAKEREATTPGELGGQGGLAPSETTAPGSLPPPGGDEALERRTRRVERAASLALGAPAEEIGDVADGVIRVTDQAGGVVLTSSVSSDANGTGGATFELRVPSERLGSTLAALSKLADVESRNQSSTDITGAFISPRERLTDALAERRALLRQLARADTPNETASIRARLRTASAQIARARAELRTLRERTSFSRVAVSVNAKEEGGGSDGWTVGDALDDALRILAVSLGIAVVGLAVLLPIALVLTGLGAVGRALRRRRRESGLDAA